MQNDPTPGAQAGAIERHAAVPRPPGLAEAGNGTERIDWLFRHSLRQQRVHPLMELVRRYREGREP
jgi:hypothetical protein